MNPILEEQLKRVVHMSRYMDSSAFFLSSVACVSVFSSGCWIYCDFSIVFIFLCCCWCFQADIEQVLTSCRAVRKIVLLDCCHQGIEMGRGECALTFAVRLWLALAVRHTKCLCGSWEEKKNLVFDTHEKVKFAMPTIQKKSPKLNGEIDLFSTCTSISALAKN